MTNTTQLKVSDAIPSLQSKWWTALLGLSLMGNLLVVGAIGGHFLGGREFDGPGKKDVVQLIPRKFFDELSASRRRELLNTLRGSHDEFKTMRANSAAAALELASVLENKIFDGASVKTVVDKFATGRESMAGKASAVVVDIIDRLTPDERTKLAAAIRERNSRGWK